MRRTTLHLTKFDVAERQLNQAIRLFFADGDPVSIHTLSEAASQVLYDIRGTHKAQSMLRDSDRIRPERRQEWLRYVHKARNFFKHADRDAKGSQEFKLIFNHFSLLDAVNMYVTAKNAWTPESLFYFGWFSLTYPHLLTKDDSPFNALVYSALNGDDPLDPTNYAVFSQAIEALRNGAIAIKGVTLEPGLPTP